MVPDLIGGLIARVRAFPDVAALTGKRVSGALRVKSETDPAGWQMPDYAIVVSLAGGLALRETQQQLARVQFAFYGPTQYDATRLWRITHPYLCPGPADPSNAWVAAGCRVWGVEQAASPVPLPDPDEGWARTLASYWITYGEVPA